MYGALWRALPGPVWLRLIILLALLALVLFALVEWVFPWAEPFFAPTDVTIRQ